MINLFNFIPSQKINMPRTPILLIFFALLMIGIVSCKKKKKDNPTPNQTEEGIAFNLDGVKEGEYNEALGASHPFKVLLTSKMPESGIVVEITAITDPGGQSIAQPPVAPTKASPVDVSVSGLEFARTCLVRVKVSSKDKPQNTIFKEFRITLKK